MNKFNIEESSLPSGIKIFNKEQILNLVKSLALKKDNNINNNKDSNKDKESSQPLLLSKDLKENNYIDFKNIVPHSYYYSTVNFNSIEKYISNLNKDHKKNLTLEDFIVKVSINLNFNKI